MRPTKWQNYMDIAEKIAERSHDAETKVGALLVKNNTFAIVATGFNGFVSGAPDDVLPNTRPDKYTFFLHSEENVMANCCKHGVSTDNCTLVCTLTPCTRCTRLMYQSGITNIIAKARYKDFGDIMSMRDIKVEEETTPEGFVRLTYSPMRSV